MRKSPASLLVLSLLVPLLFFACGTGSTGSPGSTGVSAPTTGTIAGNVTDAVKGDTLAGVTVTVKDSGGATLATTTTDPVGHYSVTAPIGSVLVYFAKDFYTPPGGMFVGVGGGLTTTINAAISEAAGGGPSVSFAAVAGDGFGYGTTIILAASANDPNDLPASLTYTWSNATDPLLGSVGGTGTAGSMTFPTMTQAMAFRPNPGNPGQYLSGYKMEDRFGILPITSDCRGQITAQVTVDDGRGRTATATITLNAASTLGDVKNVPVRTRIYLNSGHDNAIAWALSAKPAGSAASLDNTSIRNPSFRPDVSGAYTLTEGSNSMTIYAGTWFGVISGGTDTSITPDPLCTTCHNGGFAVDEFTPWAGTKHSGIFSVGINGGPGTASSDCLPCHTVGYDLGANNNGGFDDLAAAQTPPWVLPDVLQPGNWGSLLTNFPAVARLANIQCESCHGPNASGAHESTGPINNRNPFTSARISYSSEVCGPCHGDTDNHEYSDWSVPNPVDNWAHSNRSRALSDGASASCGRCHSAQGFTVFLDQLAAGNVGNINNPQVVNQAPWSSVTMANVMPVTCPACHDPHDATNANQLRVYGDTALLPAGFKVTGMGKGALCITCHNSRNGVQADNTLTWLHEDTNTYTGKLGYSAPHLATQGDVFAGHNAWFMGIGNLPMISKHAAVEDTCVGCHMTLQPKTFLSAEGTPTTNSHLFRILDEDLATVCANCHSSNVDGAGIRATTEAGLSALAAKLTGAATTLFNGTATIKIVGAVNPTTEATIGSDGNGTFAGTLVSDLALTEVHGQISLVFTTSSPVTLGGVSVSAFAVQLGNIQDNVTSTALYANNSPFVKGAWNYFLIHSDDSSGFHNPSFVQSVLNNTLAQTF